MNDNLGLPRARIFELIAQARPATVDGLAKKLGDAVAVEVIKPPEAVVVMSRVRETVDNAVFNLGEVLVTEAEVVISGVKGYMMVMGLDKAKALNGAVLDAVTASGHPLTGEIIAGLLADEGVRRNHHHRLWAAVKRTQVDFIGGQVEEFKPSDRSKDNR
ncbi:MAG TPA: phosphonate C-P lyase system protein PhnG [Negativicutes bacterium]|nr:phosphonate C-P lyase system protein PhnG [Negativicutes bacterium]